MTSHHYYEVRYIHFCGMDGSSLSGIGREQHWHRTWGEGREQENG